jgi:hypothetical protein
VAAQGAREVGTAWIPIRSAYDQQRLIALLVAGTIALATWVLVLTTVTPYKLITYTAFLAPLGVTVSTYTAAGLYFRSRHRCDERSLAEAVRYGVLAGVFAISNLALAAGHVWNAVTVVLIAAGCCAIELVFWIRGGITRESSLPTESTANYPLIERL